MANVALIHVTKRFGQSIALDDVSVTIEDEDVFVILGPPKSGKSTMLRCLLGEENVTEGRVVIGSRDVTGLPPEERFAFDLGARFDWSTISGHASVFDLVTLELRRRNIPPSEIECRVYKVADKLNITDLLGKRVEDLLSGYPFAIGPREKVEKAWRHLTASVSDVVIEDLDEIFSKVDPRHRQSWWAERAVENLLELRTCIKSPIVCTVPRPEQAVAVATRIAILRGGVLQQVDKPENILKNPANDFVANLLSSFSQSEEKE